MIIVGMFIFWGKATERIDLYNIDLLIYILYTLFSIFSLLVLKMLGFHKLEKWILLSTLIKVVSMVFI